jgi:hypothetical protein
MLLGIAAVMVGSLYLLSYSVLYTEGEVMQGLFRLLVCLVAGAVLVGFRRRKMAARCITLLGGSLLLWQGYQIRKWAMIHEDIVGVIRFAEDEKKTGQYPLTLDGYKFKREFVKSHIHGVGSHDFRPGDEGDGFWVMYFMNDSSITYWYSVKTGFGYYPD